MINDDGTWVSLNAAHLGCRGGNNLERLVIFVQADETWIGHPQGVHILQGHRRAAHGNVGGIATDLRPDQDQRHQGDGQGRQKHLHGRDQPTGPRRRAEPPSGLRLTGG